MLPRRRNTFISNSLLRRLLTRITFYCFALSSSHRLVLPPSQYYTMRTPTLAERNFRSNYCSLISYYIASDALEYTGGDSWVAIKFCDGLLLSAVHAYILWDIEDPQEHLQFLDASRTSSRASKMLPKASKTPARPKHNGRQ